MATGTVLYQAAMQLTDNQLSYEHCAVRLASCTSACNAVQWSCRTDNVWRLHAHQAALQSACTPKTHVSTMPEFQVMLHRVRPGVTSMYAQAKCVLQWVHEQAMHMLQHVRTFRSHVCVCSMSPHSAEWGDDTEVTLKLNALLPTCDTLSATSVVLCCLFLENLIKSCMGLSEIL